MDRRRFLSLVGMAAGGVLLEQAVPLGRVYSFPTDIKIIRGEVWNIRKSPLLTVDQITQEALRILDRELRFSTSLPRDALLFANGWYFR